MKFTFPTRLDIFALLTRTSDIRPHNSYVQHLVLKRITHRKSMNFYGPAVIIRRPDFKNRDWALVQNTEYVC